MMIHSHLRPWLIVVVAVALLLAALVARGCLRQPEGVVIAPPPDTLPTPDVIHDRPTPARPSLPTRIFTHPVPVTTIVTSTAPDTAAARRYARKVFEAESLRAVIARIRREGGDTDTVAVSRGVLPPVSGTYDGRTLALWLTQSTGRVMKATARLRPHFSFRAGQGDVSDTVPQVREDGWLLRTGREAAHCTPATVVLALAGALLDTDNRLRGAAIGAGGGFGACMSD